MRQKENFWRRKKHGLKGRVLIDAIVWYRAKPVPDLRDRHAINRRQISGTYVYHVP